MLYRTLHCHLLTDLLHYMFIFKCVKELITYLGHVSILNKDIISSITGLAIISYILNSSLRYE